MALVVSWDAAYPDRTEQVGMDIEDPDDMMARVGDIDLAIWTHVHVLGLQEVVGLDPGYVLRGRGLYGVPDVIGPEVGLQGRYGCVGVLEIDVILMLGAGPEGPGLEDDPGIHYEPGHLPLIYGLDRDLDLRYPFLVGDPELVSVPDREVLGVNPNVHQDLAQVHAAVLLDRHRDPVQPALVPPSSAMGIAGHP